MKRNIKLHYYYTIITLFTLLIAGMMCLHIFIPDIQFSPDENRVLTSFPPLNINSILDGSASKSLSKYIQDQFPFRTSFIELKARIETVEGKDLVNSSYILDDKIVKQFLLEDTLRLEKNIQKVESFAAKVEIPVDLILIPTATLILEDELPENHIDTNQIDLIDMVQSTTNNVNLIRVEQKLCESNFYPYYKTDHHLTIQGTGLVYEAYKEHLGFNKKDYIYETVGTGFKGTLSSKSGAFWIEGDNISRIANPSTTTNDIEVVISENNLKNTYNSVYFKENLNKKDMYTYYLDGNHSLVEVNTHQEEKQNILIIRDSYGHTLAPYLIEDYNKITFIDLRYYKGSISELAKSFDRVLVFYGLESFSTDTNLSLLR